MLEPVAETVGGAATRRWVPAIRTIAGNLRRAREAAGVTQAIAGAHLGVSPQMVQKYETGRNRISAAALVELAPLYDQPVAWFFEPEAR